MELHWLGFAWLAPRAGVALLAESLGVVADGCDPWIVGADWSICTSGVLEGDSLACNSAPRTAPARVPKSPDNGRPNAPPPICVGNFLFELELLLQLAHCQTTCPLLLGKDVPPSLRVPAVLPMREISV